MSSAILLHRRVLIQCMATATTKKDLVCSNYCVRSNCVTTHHSKFTMSSAILTGVEEVYGHRNYQDGILL